MLAAGAISAHAAPGDSAPAAQGLTIEPSLTALYDNNVYRVDTDMADPVSDIVLTPAAQIRYERDIGPRSVAIRAFAGYDQFLSESQRSKLRLDLEATGRALVGGRCAIAPLARYWQQRADYGDINAATENLQRFSTISISADCRRPAGFYPLATFRRDSTRNETEFEYADQTSHSVRAGVGYARPSLGVLTFYYERTEADRPSLDLENRSNAVGMSFERSVSPLTSISADVRWLKVSSSSIAVGDYDGPGWSLRLATRAIPRLTLTGETSRTIVNDSLIATGFAIRTAHRLTAEIALSELTSLSAFAEFARRSFRQDPAIRPFSYTRDSTNQFGAALSRRLSDRFALELSVSHGDRTTNSEISNYNATRVALSARAGF
jgi:hypothetical protein